MSEEHEIQVQLLSSAHKFLCLGEYSIHILSTSISINMVERKDIVDEIATQHVLNVLSKKSRIGQKLFLGFVLDEFGNPIIKSKEQAINILDDNQNPNFILRVAAIIFADAYKEVMKVVQNSR